MRKRVLQSVGGILLAGALGAAAWLFLRPSAEQQIRRRCAELETLLCCSHAAGPVARAGKARQARLFLTEPCRVDAPPYCTAALSRDDASKLLLRAYSYGGEYAVAFRELEIPPVRGSRAELRCSIQVNGQGGSGSFHEVRELYCILEKTGGEWCFAEIHAEEVIRK